MCCVSWVSIRLPCDAAVDIVAGSRENSTTFREVVVQRIPSELGSLQKNKNQAKILAAILVANMQFLCHEGNTMHELKLCSA